MITLAQPGDHNETIWDWDHSIGCFGIPLSCGQHIYWPYYVHKCLHFFHQYIQIIFSCAQYMHSLQRICTCGFFAHPLGLNLWSMCHWAESKSTKSLFSLKCKLSCLDSPWDIIVYDRFPDPVEFCLPLLFPLHLICIYSWKKQTRLCIANFKRTMGIVLFG